MTRDEFWQRFNDYEWNPYQPLAVILTSGARVYIDMPEQAGPGGDALTITRSTDPKKPEHYPYADIDQVIPLTDVPADPGGMRYAEFDALLGEWLAAEPFVPFVIELKSGGRVELNELGGTTRANRFILIPGVPPALTLVEFDAVARLYRKEPAAG